VNTVEAVETVEIDAPCSEVWALRRDFLRLPEYNPDVTELVREAPDRYRFMLATAHGPHQVVLTVTEAVEGESVTAALAGAMAAEETFTVEPLGSGRCRASLVLRVSVPDGLPAAGIQENGRRQIRAELDAMRALMGA
jgi:uncharacterized membrane protein